MGVQKNFAGLVLGLSFSNLAGADIRSAFQDGTVNGNIRAFYNTREYPSRTNEAGFALGGGLRAQTGPIGWASAGIGFYTAQDLGLNSSDPGKVNGRLGSDVDVLGEAYLSATFGDTAFTLGRQLLTTPFANPGDAFIIPFTFEAASLKTTEIENLSLEINYIESIKNRNGDEFIDVGLWTSNRYGVEPADTSGTLALGARYSISSLDLQAWYYDFSDFFTTTFIQAGYQFFALGPVQPFISAQFGSQSDAGEGLLGPVDSTLIGLQLGGALGRAKVELAHNRVDEQEGAFLNGAFLAPYSFSTSPLFTNNMLETLENVDAGQASKVTFYYNLSNLNVKISHAILDFNSAPDRDATDLDITYNMAQYLEGLSLRWRLEVVKSDVQSVEQTNHRFQLQFTF